MRILTLNDNAFNQMSHSQRQNQILEILQTKGECSVDYLAKKFDTSGMTVRRDLRILADQGRVIRTHGGAAIANGVNFEFAFLKRTKLNKLQKEAIGNLAASLIKDGQSVVLDSGTTTLAIAEQLRHRRGVKVVTTSLPVASLLQYNEMIEINLLGGQLRPRSPDLSGAITEANLDMLCADIAFVGAEAVDAKGGVLPNPPNFANACEDTNECETSLFVADSSKLGMTALWRFADLKQLAGLITDYDADSSFINSLTKIGIKVLRAGRGGRERR